MNERRIDALSTAIDVARMAAREGNVLVITVAHMIETEWAHLSEVYDWGYKTIDKCVACNCGNLVVTWQFAEFFDADGDEISGPLEHVHEHQDSIVGTVGVIASRSATEAEMNQYLSDMLDRAEDTLAGEEPD